MARVGSSIPCKRLHCEQREHKGLYAQPRAGAGNPDRADVESARESEPKASAPAAKNTDFSDDDIPF